MQISQTEGLGQRRASNGYALFRIAIPSFRKAPWRRAIVPAKANGMSRSDVAGLFGDLLAAKTVVVLAERDAKGAR